MTDESLKNFCNVPEEMLEQLPAGGLRQWPIGHKLTWTIVQRLSEFSLDEQVDVLKEAWRPWDTMSGLVLEYRSSPPANVLVGSRAIDAPGGVLAEAQLPWPGIHPGTQLRVWFDTREQWTTATNWRGTGRAPLLPVARHEFGHSLGIGHNEDGLINAIMDPSISHLVELQKWDIDQIQARYGKVSPPPGGEGDRKELLELLIACLEGLPDDQIKRALRLWREEMMTAPK